ncbi:hypothetical protein H7Q97_19320 [Ochrobactrum sp. CM-21-5]|nr:hypothetical protein [Ochrobactrum sp. CM-21-5]MBC2887532.1 hypothetical protein [Ochrobactrum sp. CM-21-5]
MKNGLEMKNVHSQMSCAVAKKGAAGIKEFATTGISPPCMIPKSAQRFSERDHAEKCIMSL